MVLRFGVLLLFVFALMGCAIGPAAPVAQLTPAQLWRDSAFSYHADRVTESKRSLLDLDPQLADQLNDPALQKLSADRRLIYLVGLFFPAGKIAFSYSAGHSTGAADTWRNKKGDCLSLTLLTYAAAKALGISAQMQEVRVPVALDRRGTLDFLNGHVNVSVPNLSALTIGGRHFPAGGIIIDFEPQIGSRQRGAELSDDAILARYYNNRAAEYLAQDNDNVSYAYFKSAIIADATFAAPYGNLAQLYLRYGLADAAEQLLRHAIALNADADPALRALHNLLLAQGRTAEAQKYADLLQKHQDEDPYYWLGVGIDALKHERYSRAIHALEQAESLTTGFEEIHRYLAVAYWRNGQQSAANKQLSVLTAMSQGDPALAILSKKLRGNPPNRNVH